MVSAWALVSVVALVPASKEAWAPALAVESEAASEAAWAEAWVPESAAGVAEEEVVVALWAAMWESAGMSVPA